MKIKIENLLYALQKSLTINKFYRGTIHYNPTTRTVSSDQNDHDQKIFLAVQKFIAEIESIES